jgi:hypothetical protein
VKLKKSVLRVFCELRGETMSFSAFPALSAVILISACSTATQTEANQQPADNSACMAEPGGAGGPITDPSGPYYHQVVVAPATDGVPGLPNKQVLDHASVPDGVRLADGRTLIYYVNGATGTISIARLFADTAAVIGTLTIDGVNNPRGVVDPDAILHNGRVRLFYLSGFGPPGSGTNRAICMAESIDGISFTSPSVALTMQPSELLTDPSVVQLRDGTWRMAISLGQQTVLASSNDGITFTRYQTVSFGGVPEIALTADGRLRLYVCARGIESYLSTDGGHVWQYERVIMQPGVNGRQIVCDPSVAGNWFIFKTG